MGGGSLILGLPRLTILVMATFVISEAAAAAALAAGSIGPWRQAPLKFASTTALVMMFAAAILAFVHVVRHPWTMHGAP